MTTAQEQAWKGDFGNQYNARSPGDEEANVAFFTKALHRLRHKGIASIIELGAGTGANIRALRRLHQNADICALEINAEAVQKMIVDQAADDVLLTSLTEFVPNRQWDLSFTKGVLIHVEPAQLPQAYDALFNASRRWIMVAEYYNPTPVYVPYRGHDNLLFKRDFAGDMLKKYPLKLVDYGFVYHGDDHPQDDLTWFLMEKKS